MTLAQVDSLWDWLANDQQCSDCLFSWMQSQCQGGEQHALGVTALRHLYLTKLPTLQPEVYKLFLYLSKLDNFNFSTKH